MGWRHRGSPHATQDAQPGTGPAHQRDPTAAATAWRDTLLVAYLHLMAAARAVSPLIGVAKILQTKLGGAPKGESSQAAPKSAVRRANPHSPARDPAEAQIRRVLWRQVPPRSASGAEEHGRGAIRLHGVTYQGPPRRQNTP